METESKAARIAEWLRGLPDVEYAHPVTVRIGRGLYPAARYLRTFPPAPGARVTTPREFVAYAYRRGAELRSGPHATREAAAAEIFSAHPTIRDCASCVFFNGRPTGADIRSHARPADMAGAHATWKGR